MQAFGPRKCSVHPSASGLQQRIQFDTTTVADFVLCKPSLVSTAFSPQARMCAGPEGGVSVSILESACQIAFVKVDEGKREKAKIAPVLSSCLFSTIASIRHNPRLGGTNPAAGPRPVHAAIGETLAPRSVAGYYAQRAPSQPRPKSEASRGLTQCWSLADTTSHRRLSVRPIYFLLLFGQDGIPVGTNRYIKNPSG